MGTGGRKERGAPETPGSSLRQLTGSFPPSLSFLPSPSPPPLLPHPLHHDLIPMFLARMIPAVGTSETVSPATCAKIPEADSYATSVWEQPKVKIVYEKVSAQSHLVTRCLGKTHLEDFHLETFLFPAWKALRPKPVPRWGWGAGGPVLSRAASSRLWGPVGRVECPGRPTGHVLGQQVQEPFRKKLAGTQGRPSERLP